ncbi:hypothetical protein HN371_23535 [Candidatus Poribacteria bacterium]|nr:hypothetical protein [Candidatus Poribacteria bacterium]MBT5534931.1 hypothetical protein [Candidatus Poribacteria bacterium]MBT5711414.1 hypothetical protein [Candidatus Poribacteria bacterium]MBT7099994.1 hypothetical protein [Candidatus Poribacteria bacterium]MBT7808881.1 hypothetical protein [Candidatus Poribacteria bacterium]
MPHRKWVRWVNFSPDRKYVVTGSEDMTAQLWDVATGRRVAAPLRHTSAVLSAEFSPDGKHIATVSSQGSRLWSLPGIPKSLSEVRRRTALATGTRLTRSGPMESLSHAGWRAIRANSSTAAETALSDPEPISSGLPLGSLTDLSFLGRHRGAAASQER